MIQRAADDFIRHAAEEDTPQAHRHTLLTAQVIQILLTRWPESAWAKKVIDQLLDANELHQRVTAELIAEGVE